MELREYVPVLGKYWHSVVAAVLVGLLGTAIYSIVVTPTYTAKSSLFFSVEGATSPGDLAQGSSFAQAQMASYVRLATSPLVLEPVIADNGLSSTPVDLAKQVKVSAPTDTSIIDISVTNSNPETAASIANAVGKQLVSEVSRLSPENARGQKAVVATVIAPAAIPGTVTSPKVPQTLLLGLLLGLLVGLGQALVRNAVDTRVRTVADVAEITDLPVVGQIDFEKSVDGDHEASLVARSSPRVEAFRRLRTNLQYLNGGRGSRSFVITSATPDEGKTSISVNISAVLAASGLRVLLIDADMRNPSVAGALGLDNAVGLSALLIERASFEEVLQVSGEPRFHVLVAGQQPPNPPELLGSSIMVDLLETAAQMFDIVVIDAPPLLPVTDAAVLTRMAGGALLVVGSGDVRKPEVADALASLAAVEGRVLGIVMNKIHVEHTGYSGYYAYRQPTADTGAKWGADR